MIASKYYPFAAAGAVVLLIIVALLVRRFRKPKMKVVKYTERWKDLQKNCASRKTWPKAIVEADALLDDVLKRKHYKGKTTGERLVAAQHELTSNEQVWFGHKLRNSIVGEDVRKLRKQDIFEALEGFRQALRDLGALAPLKSDAAVPPIEEPKK